ncbi:hypothetical protein BH20VER3_BH20VER3_14810 [soil metagenome]
MRSPLSAGVFLTLVAVGVSALNRGVSPAQQVNQEIAQRLGAHVILPEGDHALLKWPLGQGIPPPVISRGCDGGYVSGNGTAPKETVEKLERVARRGRRGGWQGASEAHPCEGLERASDAARRPFCLAPQGLRCFRPWPALLVLSRWQGYRPCARALARAENNSNATHSSISAVS